MHKARARQIIRALVSGVDPHSGVDLPETSPVHDVHTIRALVMVHEALDETRPRGGRIRPPRAGKRWTESEDGRLRDEFMRGASIPDLAEALQRTQFAIIGRLLVSGQLQLPMTQRPIGPDSAPRAQSKVPGHPE